MSESPTWNPPSPAWTDDFRALLEQMERKAQAQGWAETHDPVVRVLCSKCRKTRGTNGVFATDVGLALIITSWLGVSSADETEWIKRRKAEHRPERYSSVAVAMLDSPEPMSFRCACSHEVRWVDWAVVKGAVHSSRRRDLPI